MAQAKTNRLPYRHKYYWLYLLALALLVYWVLPELPSFHQSLEIVGRANWRWLILAVLLNVLTYNLAAAKYYALALRPIRYWRMVLVQFASALANRLLPAGLGGMGISFAYLHRLRHTRSEATVVVGMNNLVGLVGHAALLLIVLLLSHQRLGHALPRLPWHTAGLWIGAGLLLLVIAVCVVGRKLRKIAQTLLQCLKFYAAKPAKLSAATLYAALLALMHVLIIECVAAALGYHLTTGVSLLALTGGVAVGSVSPTPGGLVGVEAGMVATLVLYGLAPSASLAVTLLYRLITYWLGLLLGGLAVLWLGRQGDL